MRLEIPVGSAPPDGEVPAEHALLEAVIGSSLVLVFRMAPADLSLRYVSPNVVDVLGYRPEEVLGVPGWWVDHLHPEETDEIVAALGRDLETRVGRGEHEFRFRHRDGSYRWFQARVALLGGEGSSDDSVIGYAVDVTKRRAAEDKLRETEEKFRSLVEHIPAVVYLADFGEDGVWRYVSPKIQDVLGFEAEEWEADRRRWYRQVHPDDRERVLVEERVSRERGVPLRSEYRMLTRDGRVVFVRDEAEVILNEMGHATGLRGVMHDITDRRTAEEALKASEAQLRALFASMSDVILVLDRNGRYLQIAPTATELLYRPPDELLGRTLHEVFPEEQADFFLGAVLRALDGRRTVFIEYCLPIAGSEVWFSAALSPMLDDSVVVVARDVTERRQGEQTLRESEERHRLVVETIPDGIAVHVAGRVAFLNTSGARILGAGSPQELLGRPVLDFVHPDYRAVVAERMREMLDEGRPAPLLHERFVRVDGSTIDVEVVASPLTFQGERAVLVVFRDVTEREEMGRALGEAEAKYRTLVEQLPAVVYVGEYGEEGDWLYISPQLERVLGYRPEEWLAHPHPMTSLTHPDDLASFRTQEERSRSTGEDFSAEVRMLTKNGPWRWILHEATAVRDEAGRPLFLQGLMYDITERKQVEEQLRSSGELIRRLFGRLVEAQEEERARIASDIHDDSIQAVTAVALRLEGLRKRLSDEGSVEAVRKLQIAVEAAIRRMRHLLFELRPRTLDEDGLASTLRLYLDQMGEQTGVASSIDNRLVEEPPREARIVLYRIAQEALTNVRKHAHATRVDVLLEARDRGFLVRVTDDGNGFSPGGNGTPGHLGLSSMRERAEMAGGWWRIGSAPHAGTTVEFWIPAAGV